MKSASGACWPQGQPFLQHLQRDDPPSVYSQTSPWQAYTQAGRFADACLTLDEGLALAEKNDERCQDAELHRLKGELLLAEAPDQVSGAEDCFRQAIETARRQQSRAWELRATMSLARLWQRQGRRDEARAVLTAVYGTFTEGFMTPDLVDAAAQLNGLA